MNYKPIARVDFIVIHCTATREGQPFKASDIDRWHREKGWRMIGYNRVVLLDGTVEQGRPDDMPGAHAEGYNSRSIGVVYVGGLAADGKTPKDTRTDAQKRSLLRVIRELKQKHPNAVVLGHRDLPKVAKACPSFDAKTEYAAV